MHSMNPQKNNRIYGLGTLAILLVSTLAFAISSAPAAHAAVTATSKIDVNVLTTNTTQTRAITIANPIGSEDLTEVKVQAPTSLFSNVTGATTTGGGFATGTTASVTGIGPWVILVAVSGGGTILPAGATGRIFFTVKTNTATTTSGEADSAALSTVVKSASGQTAVPSSTVFLTDAAAVILTAASPLSIVAGTTKTLTINASGNAGFAVSLSANTTTATFSPSTVTTTSTTVTSTFRDTKAGATVVKAKVGTPVSGASSTGFPASASLTFTVNASAPTKVTVKLLTFDVADTTITYLTGNETSLKASLADEFGNSVKPGGTSSSTVTFSATSGTFPAGTGSLIAPTGSISSPAKSYAPAKTWGTFALITATILLPSDATFSPGPYTGSSKQLVTSTFANSTTTSIWP